MEDGVMTQSAKSVSIIGGGVAAAQCALTLAQLGVEVSIITPFMELDPGSAAVGTRNFTSQDLIRIRPLLLRTVGHPQVSFYTNSRVNSITGKRDKFVIKGNMYPRYVRQDLCTSCGRCAEECSIQVPFIYNGKWLAHSAIHKSVVGNNAVPSAYSIDKKGVAPCTARCPLNINVTGFVSLLAKGKIDSALSLINESAPLAGVLGRVCTHPCEDSCTRSEVDKPVFIKALHRYAADYGGDIKYKRKAPANSRREKIGIVGSGPAGLAVAWELARRGYSPIIFESHAVVGGMLATGIPRFRLPRETREREVRAIEELGVEIRTGVTIGRDVTITDLRERGYRAFFLGIGAHENRKLNIPGEDLEGVVDSISMLFELNLRVGATVGKNMVVIGGGNSAVDSARTARRRGKRNVTILYRRTAEEMTAVKEDIEEALMEGISIQYLTQPIEILGDRGRVTAVRCQQMVMGEPGEDGRRKPQPVPGSEFVIDADHVVLAIGQQPNTAQLNKKNIEVNSKDSTVKVDPLTLQTSEPSVFAGGDCVTGPNSVVAAVAAGLQAAESIDRYVRGRSLTKGRSLEKPQPVEVDINERHVSPDKRAEMPLIPRSQRLGTFEETSTGLPQKVAEQEAGRCVNCSLCSGCLECMQVCELGRCLPWRFHQKYRGDGKCDNQL
jgi:NADPH-dependent glutamate synthase beta subunit-like oxidoreductase